MVLMEMPVGGFDALAVPSSTSEGAVCTCVRSCSGRLRRTTKVGTPAGAGPGCGRDVRVGRTEHIRFTQRIIYITLFQRHSV